MPAKEIEETKTTKITVNICAKCGSEWRGPNYVPINCCICGEVFCRKCSIISDEGADGEEDGYTHVYCKRCNTVGIPFKRKIDDIRDMAKYSVKLQVIAWKQLIKDDDKRWK